MLPPVVARYVPSRKTLAIVARVAFWPTAWVLVSAAAPPAVLPLVFVTVAFVTAASSVATRRAPVAGVARVAATILVFVTASIGAHRMFAEWGGVIPVIVGAAYAWMLYGVREPVVAPNALDVDVRALAPFSVWMATVAVLIRWTAETAHLHVVVPQIAIVAALISTVAAIVGLVTVVRQRAWTKNVYAGRATPLRVAPIAQDVDASAIDPLAAVPESTSVIVDVPEALGPYRAHGSTAIARVPAKPGGLFRHYAKRIAEAAFAGGVATAALGLVASNAASAVHDEDAATVPKELGPLPASCSFGAPSLRFVALAPLLLTDVDSIAARYRSALKADVRVEVPLPFEERFIDSSRDQIIAEEVLAAARSAYPRRSANELLVVVTDRDMYLREREWRWAFASRRDGVAIVSLARMDPAFLWNDPARYSPRVPMCAATVRARAFKMITRQILFGACQAEPIDNAHSERRASINSLPDLDAMDEAHL